MSYRADKKALGNCGARQTTHENVMGGLYLGIAFTGVNALIATGLVIALM
jgi:hypothetical protein